MNLHVTVALPADRRTHVGVIAHVRDDKQVDQHAGLAVTKPNQMFVELSQTLSLVDLVVVGDAMVRKRG